MDSWHRLAVLEDTPSLLMIILLLCRVWRQFAPPSPFICLLASSNGNIYLPLVYTSRTLLTFGGIGNPKDLATFTRSNLLISKIDLFEYEA